MSHLYAQDPALNHRMMVVESSVDSRVLDFVHQVAGAREVVCGVGDETVQGELQIGGSEVPLKNRRNHGGDAAVSSRILGMSWCVRQRRPIGVGREGGIAAACTNSSYRPPKAKGELGIPAADGGVGESGPQHGHQSRGIGSVEPLLGGQISEGAAILLAEVLRPAKAKLCLLWGSNSAVYRSKGHHLGVIVNPLPAVESVWALVREELRCARHGERHHLA